jgi:predicted metal-binding membrane protein
MINDSSVIETVVKRNRLIVIGGLVAVVLLSWIYILDAPGMGMTAFEMTAITQYTPAMVMQPTVWTPTYALFMFFMWWVMMIAMMIPSASPMILLFAAINRKQREKGAPFVSTSVFALGYIIAWGGFSLLATALQWALERVGLMSTMMIATSGLFSGLVLVVAGVYQLTPLKHTCLRHCRSPIQFVTHHWRKGPGGALRMGVEHGVFCLGCCWSLMALLFVGGVMNLFWIVGLAIFVLLEKTIPAGHQLGSLGGIGLIVWGVWMLTIAL